MFENLKLKLPLMSNLVEIWTKKVIEVALGRVIFMAFAIKGGGLSAIRLFSTKKTDIFCAFGPF